MCTDLRPVDLESIGVWKIVAEKDGEYYSPATGVKYPKKGAVPVPKKAHPLVNVFNEYFLVNPICGFHPNMAGRTAAFLERYNAESIWRGWVNRCLLGYTLLIKRARVSQELMIGKYANATVYAGKYIEFLE